MSIMGMQLLYDPNYSYFLMPDSSQIKEVKKHISDYLIEQRYSGIVRTDDFIILLQRTYGILLKKLNTLINSFDRKNLLFFSMDQLGRITQSMWRYKKLLQAMI